MFVNVFNLLIILIKHYKNDDSLTSTPSIFLKNKIIKYSLHLKLDVLFIFICLELFVSFILSIHHLLLFSLMRNASNTHFSILSLALTGLLNEVNVCLTTLYGFNF